MALIAESFRQPELYSHERPEIPGAGLAGYGRLLAKRDDRLLRDVGLTREDVLGAERYFWFEWMRIREPWAL